MIAICVATATMTPIATAAEPISLSWRLIGNRPEGGYQAELTIRNDGTTPLADDWTIYFNSASRLLPASLSAGFELTHINGDFYSLGPGADYVPIPPRGSSAVAWEGSPWAINVSDAPSGFYMAPGKGVNRPAKPVSLPLRIERFPDADKLRRGAADLEPVVTAESRFRENESLKLLPPETLIKVVPTPIDVKPLNGKATVGNSSIIYYGPQLESVAGHLADALQPLLGARIATKPAAGPTRRAGCINIFIGDVPVGNDLKQSRDEAYELNVSDEIGITGSEAAGVFYGVQTLRALLPIAAYSRPATELHVDAVKIVDAPRFRYRGAHLDVARNFQRKETVEKLLDVMAFYKLNRFHWHLTDDEGWRLEIPQLPELTNIGGRRGHSLSENECLYPSHGSGPDPAATNSPGNGFYTRSDMVAILRYAAARYITVIPEIDLPGHARAAIKSIEARGRKMSEGGADPKGAPLLLRDSDDPSRYESVQLWRDNVVDVCRDDAYQFLSLVVAELREIYEQAGVPLTAIHLGGDEVPKGAWEASAAGKDVTIASSAKIPRHGQLELYFLDRASDVLARNSIQPGCWEDCPLLEIDQAANAGNTRRTAGKTPPITYVWDNVWGWGREDAAYRLANAGFDVVLCNATHLYFDLACEKDPLEAGYYWAGFVDARKPFEFVPLDVFQNADRTSMGQPVDPESLAKRTRLTSEGARHILGIQGQLWGENLRSARILEYMAFPRLLALAERAWAQSPEWAEIEDAAARRERLESDWNQFANRLGQRELPRLDWHVGGIHYRLPPPGALARDGLLVANVAFPGLQIRYTDDGSEPDSSARLYSEPIPIRSEIRLRSFDTRGRCSRTTRVFCDD